MSKEEKILECHIKSLVLEKLIKSGFSKNETTLISELTLNNFSRRVDLAVINKESFIGFEIKSEYDSLKRLEGQLSTYSAYFDKVIVVASTKHINNILESVPKNIGIWEVRDNKIIIKRKGIKKYTKNKKNLIQLMRVDELKKLARSLNIKTNSMLRADLEETLIKHPTSVLKSHVLNSLSDRFKKSSNKFFDSISESNNITSENIYLLSRFHEKRKINASRNQLKKRAWEGINKKTKEEILLGLAKFKKRVK
ncbi:MAG: sce7726 family protein [Hydrogenovibrio sp.]|nr:sce7726 family protein [Hydrogenovibrio sp.]